MREIESQQSINQRINFLIDHFERGNKSAFGRRVDMKSGVVGDLVGGRLNKPSYDAIVKILSAYPSVSTDWLVLGRGPMLQNDENHFDIDHKLPKKYLTIDESQRQIEQLKQEMQAEASSYIEAWKDSEKLLQVYRLRGAHPASRMLSDRLSMTEEEARELVLSGRIRSTYVGKDNDRARQNGVSYFVSEEAVREFLRDNHTSQSK
jgi:hypothetical protein